MKKTTSRFISEANKIHNNFYDYSLTNYINCNTKIKIICPIHREFEQTPYHHLNRKQGCPICGYKKSSVKQQLSISEFIEKAKKNHNELYDYSLVDYNGYYSKVKIICKKCGNVFEQTPSNHLNSRDWGCLFCNFSKGENQISKILLENNIEFIQQKRFDDCKDKKPLPFDFYIPSKKLLIEYNGIQHYQSIDKFGGEKQLHLQRHHDWLKRKYAFTNNYKFVIIKYNENIQEKLQEILNGTVG